MVTKKLASYAKWVLEAHSDWGFPKTTRFLGVVVVSLYFTGCLTTPVAYSYVEDGGEAATMTVVSGSPGLTLLYINGDELPKPEEKTRWDPFKLPAGVPLKLTVHAYYEQSSSSNMGLIALLATSAITASRSIDTDVTFECPPLDAGKTYKLTFRKGAGLKGKNTILLNDTKTGKFVHEQEFSAN
ncbi:MAG: hypothetical protein LBD20_00885 [Spirochaetaceae bacterium]|jgi:hypothetical protein|nr:hypothetical protein [Spirochaetaceae bacterium]